MRFLRKISAWLFAAALFVSVGALFAVSSETTTVQADSTTFSGDEVTCGNATEYGEGKDVWKFDVTFPSITWDRENVWDYCYDGWVSLRQNIFINGTSLVEINQTTDDSGYSYNSFPWTHEDKASFRHPVLLSAKDGTLSVYVHKQYVQSLAGQEIVLKVASGFSYNGATLTEDVSFALTAEVTLNDATLYALKGQTIGSLAESTGFTMTQPNTLDSNGVGVYGWTDGNGAALDLSQVVTENVTLKGGYSYAAYKPTKITQLLYYNGINADNTPGTDNWLVFTLSDYDTPNEEVRFENKDTIRAELERIGFLASVRLKGTFYFRGGVTKTETTLQEVFDAFGISDPAYFNIWSEKNTFAIRLTHSGTLHKVDSITLSAGTTFPSYARNISKDDSDVRYALEEETSFYYIDTTSKGDRYYGDTLNTVYDIHMATGASIRLAGNSEKSGIRFRTEISEETVNALKADKDSGIYTDVSFGTLIVPTDMLMGGNFTHEWLNANGLAHLDIKSSAGFDGWAFEENGVCGFYGSIVKIKETNLNRKFSGIGYVKLTKSDGTVRYVYAEYEAANARSASWIAQAAITDRMQSATLQYPNRVAENDNYSPYTDVQRNNLKEWYLKDISLEGVASQKLTNLANEGGTQEVVIPEEYRKLAGAYVTLRYSANVDVTGVFYYQNEDGTQTAEEDFYLKKGTIEHKQFLDIYRPNGVGYGLSADNLYLTKIKFSNVGEKGGNVRFLSLSSQARVWNSGELEVYVTKTVADKDDNTFSMTVGAHLGLGGALTYLARSGIYEGVTDGGWETNFWGTPTTKKGNVKLQTTKDGFVDENKYGHYFSWGYKYNTESGYYGHETSSLPSDGAVNLINNYDVGRQIQQSWYANVNDANGYTQADCTTSGETIKWQYNPVQAGDCANNASQIIDYEVTKDYIYVKTRAMDWAKGQTDANLEGTIKGGSTTKSYMENYYRLNDDGTLTVNNSFVDWNGFSNMESIGFNGIELPAVYTVQSLNYYVSQNADGGLTYNDGLSAWTSNAYVESNTAGSKHGDWFAWANGNDENAMALGMYIPNVERFTSGRTATSTACSVANNVNARENALSTRGLMSNMQEIEYSYQGAYVFNTSYTAPGVTVRMEEYKTIEYSYVISVNTIKTIQSQFDDLAESGKVTNAGNGFDKVGLDAWARADKRWTN